MSKMKEIENNSDAQLIELVSQKREQVRQTRFGTVSRDVKAVKAAKKDIARALTVLAKRAKDTANNVTK
jgi:ribosomal protein L29